MTVADGRFTITYNGEIYNFGALRQSLLGAGVAFQSHSDTEVILRLYQAEGPACVERLRGMFALAIWDEAEQTCFLARDRFGIKPLYFHDTGSRLAFASETRALVASGLVAPQVDRQAAYEYFRTGSVPEPLTLIAGVTALEAGHHLTWCAGRRVSKRYWAISFRRGPLAGDPVARTREALIDSIKHHFVSDVPVGVFLSGGVDSTAIVALAQAAGMGPLPTFSLTFPGFDVDEGPAARRTAAHFGTTHTEHPLDSAGARQLFHQFIGSADQPSIDGFNTYTVSRLARTHGIKVALSGLGGDELFGGYPSFRAVPRLLRLARLARLGGPLAPAAVRLAGVVGGSRIARMADLVSAPPTLSTAYRAFRGIFSDRDAAALTGLLTDPGEASWTADQAIGGAPAAEDDDPTVLDAISRLEVSRYMRNQLLRDADVMSMASGVELRVPFLDASLVAAVTDIPSEVRCRPGKDLLVRAVPELPPWVANQPKRGFLFPMAQWLDRDWSEALQDGGGVSGVKLDTWYRRWAVMAFRQWRERLREHHG